MDTNILQIGNPVLRQVARPLTVEEIMSSEIQQLIVFMKKTMREAPGVGLAAPQIGMLLQLAVIEDKLEYHQSLSSEQLKARERLPISFQVIINPILTVINEEKVEFYESCLSMAGFVGKVARALEVKVDCLNEKGQVSSILARGWYARILQHEIDHLQGILCIDRMQLPSLTTSDNFNQYWKS